MKYLLLWTVVQFYGHFVIFCGATNYALRKEETLYLTQLIGGMILLISNRIVYYPRVKSHGLFVFVSEGLILGSIFYFIYQFYLDNID